MKRPPNKSRGEYRPIYEALLDHPKFQALSPEARLLLFALKLTLGPLGIRAVYEAVLAEQTGLHIESVELAAQELEERGWLRREWRLWWLVDGLEHEPSISLTNGNHRTYILRELEALPNLGIVHDFAVHYEMGEWETPSPPPSPPPPPSEGIPHPLPDPNPNHNPNPDPDADAVRTREAAAAAVENGLDLPEPAVAALAELAHPSSRRATERTLEARFLDPDDSSPMLDASVRGLPLAKRQELVAAALLEYGDQAGEWKAQRFAAFVRKIRTRPKPGTEAALVEARGEPGVGRYVPATPYREDGPRELAKIDARALLGAAGIRAPTTTGGQDED